MGREGSLLEAEQRELAARSLLSVARKRLPITEDVRVKAFGTLKVAATDVWACMQC